MRGAASIVIVLAAAGCAQSHDDVDAGPLPDAFVVPDAGPQPDPVQFCTHRETYRCARDLAAGRIDMTAYNACASRIDATCQHFVWPPGCAVTQARADACIMAVSDAMRLSQTYEMLTECADATLCGP